MKIFTVSLKTWRYHSSSLMLDQNSHLFHGYQIFHVLICEGRHGRYDHFVEDDHAHDLFRDPTLYHALCHEKSDHDHCAHDHDPNLDLFPDHVRRDLDHYDHFDHYDHYDHGRDRGLYHDHVHDHNLDRVVLTRDNYHDFVVFCHRHHLSVHCDCETNYFVLGVYHHLHHNHPLFRNDYIIISES
jgi:hypothetical protein